MNYLLSLYRKVKGNTAIKAVAHNMYFACKSFQCYQQPGKSRNFHQNSKERQKLILSMVFAPSVSLTHAPGKAAGSTPSRRYHHKLSSIKCISALMISISVLRGFCSHLEATSAAIHITLPQMPARVVAQHCKQCNKLGRLARQERRAADASPRQTLSNHSTAWDSWLKKQLLLMCWSQPRDCSTNRSWAHTGILGCSQPGPSSQHGNDGTPESKERENSVSPSPHSPHTEGLKVQPHSAAVGEEPCDKALAVMASWLTRQLTAMWVDPATVGTLSSWGCSRQLGHWTTARNKFGSFADLSLGVFFSSLNFRQCLQWDQT